MSPASWKIATALFVLGAVCVVGAAVTGSPAPAAGPASAKERQQTWADARGKAAKKAYEQLFEAHRLGTGSLPMPEAVYLWSRRWAEAEQEASSKRADRVTALQGHLDRMKELEARTRQQVEKTKGGEVRLLAVEYYRAEAEFWLARAIAE